MSAAQRLIQLDPTKSIIPFGDGTNHQFSHSDMKDMGDPSGISIEEGEFLYGLVRILRPTNCVETGTNIGVSASYICLALQDNGMGHLTTIEHDSTVYDLGNAKLSSMGFRNYGMLLCKVSDHITMINSFGDANSQIKDGIDFLWLDSELDQRFAELLAYFPHMNDGAVACIHDLWHLDFDQFGGVPPDLHELIKSGKLRAVTFRTPHGVTMFQKRRGTDVLADISLGIYPTSHAVEIHEQMK